jgi:hypothetical protein
MTSFAHVDYPTEHPGVVRAQRFARLLSRSSDRFDGGRAAAALFLGAIVAAFLVVANEVADSWGDGYLLAAWIIMWAVAFGTLAVFAQPLGRAFAQFRSWRTRITAKRRQAAEDEKLWRLALTDARVMADISRAMTAAGTVRNLKTYY